MTFDRSTVLAVAAMALALYVCRIGGYLLLRSAGTGPFTTALLRYLPGALFVAYVVLTLVAGGVQGWVGAAATAGVMATTRSLAAAIVAGVAACWAAWLLRAA